MGKFYNVSLENIKGPKYCYFQSSQQSDRVNTVILLVMEIRKLEEKETKKLIQDSSKKICNPLKSYEMKRKTVPMKSVLWINLVLSCF